MSRNTPHLPFSVIAAGLIAANLRADIRGTTRVRCYVRELETPCTAPLRDGGVVAGSGVDGSYLEAMIDAGQVLLALKNAVEAALARDLPEAGQQLKEAYDEAIELQESAGDRTSVQKTYVRLDQAAPYTRVTLTFETSSDDDPFRDLLVAAPRVRYTLPPNASGDDGSPVPTRGSKLEAIVVEPVEGGRGSRSGKAVVTLYPKRMPQGAFYPILFSTKEDDCGICLGILHDVEVSTYKTCADVLLPGTYCQTKAGEFDRNVEEINRNYDAAYRVPELTRAGRARQRYCGADANGNPRFPPPSGCTNQAEERLYPGACREWVSGLSVQTCGRIAPYFRRIRQLEADNEKLANTIRLNDCCSEYVNPAGGNGIKQENEMFQTAPQAQRHPREAASVGHDPAGPENHPTLHGHPSPVPAITPAPR